MNSDFKDLLRFLNEEKVSYMIAGGYAVMHHSQPRYTKDLNIWIKPSLENAFDSSTCGLLKSILAHQDDQS